MAGMDKTKISVDLDNEMLARILKMRVEEGVSMRWVIHKALQLFFSYKERSKCKQTSSRGGLTAG